ncbi:hypothetical protein FT663_01285 [Candidozyma haemuli var. vulneris]|uniref:Mitochondrial inner membrane i-AAA protease supercomplex subunit MGR3 n=1 Tax=Candidozyma haemuli TaxID=45357 RepID=A0A2V1AX66_9ASCO|nr:hypothetical protein CXQ85_004962 [[Candida] haemuloni]KAF3992150.1 hypothetical protein FT662_01320 [[Candida] haemuloni var. vulneris]KAF3994595.1 hypothetical protein FT663_01285 [[Candida] haemuloni var. vulneris]PVH22394.1 hypothetical protein CXQ85_004962 [[Candida] haemuloni]
MLARTLKAQSRQLRPGIAPRLSIRAPQFRLAQSRLYNQYPYIQQAYKPSRFKKSLYFAIAFVTVSTFAYYYFWPKHTFPKSVAKILRKGLWAESNKGNADWSLALKYYIEALQECDSLDMDTLSDEYTGIQLKIAEMYERLGMNEDASLLLTELNTYYVSVLTAPPGSDLAKKVKNKAHRGRLIQRSLRTALKACQFMDGSPGFAKAFLITNLIIANDEAKSKMAGDLIAAATEGKEEFKELQGKTLNESNPDAFFPFAEEYFGVCDLLAVISIQLNDIETGLWARMLMTEDMIQANMSQDRIMLSQCNVASMLYMLMEKREGELLIHQRHVIERSDVLDKDELSKKDIRQLRSQATKYMTNEEKQVNDVILESIKRLQSLVISTYDTIVTAWKKMPAELKNDSMDQTAAIATYGLGVVHLHLGTYREAERYLREARVRSKNCSYDVLLSEIEREMEKLKQEKNKASQRASDEHQSGSDLLQANEVIDEIEATPVQANE